MSQVEYVQRFLVLWELKIEILLFHCFAFCPPPFYLSTSISCTFYPYKVVNIYILFCNLNEIFGALFLYGSYIF